VDRDGTGSRRGRSFDHIAARSFRRDRSTSLPRVGIHIAASGDRVTAGFTRIVLQPRTMHRKPRCEVDVSISQCARTKPAADGQLQRSRRKKQDGTDPMAAPSAIHQIRRRAPRPGVTAAATTAVFATGEGPGETAFATTAVLATGWPMTPTRPTRPGPRGMIRLLRLRVPHRPRSRR
jgi:hypothetical protein